MNGEECHNEWEITHEEIHRNGAIAFAIFNYYRFTGDYSYIPEKGLEVLIGIARFGTKELISLIKNQYVILGVTGPNEYENNVNNNSIPTLLQNGVLIIRTHNFRKFRWNFRLTTNVLLKTKLADSELKEWKKVADNMYFPVSKDLGYTCNKMAFRQRFSSSKDMDATQRPIKMVLGPRIAFPYIKQADVLMLLFL
jgi:maltose phosphorylase